MRRATFGIIAGIYCLAVLPGCNTTDPPLIFGKVDTFGASVSASAPDQGGNVVLGYRSAKLAIVPVTARDAYGNLTVLKVKRDSATQRAEGEFSTFAHFEASAAATGTKACLGDTFATGFAAQTLADKLPQVCK